MTPQQWATVLAEELPTGLFGGPRPHPPIEERPVDPHAAEHRADLLAALDDAGNDTHHPCPTTRTED